jgi:hypothetical protein
LNDRRKDLVAAVIIFAVTFVAFRTSPVRTISDSGFEMLFSQNLLWHHSFSVEPYIIPALKSHRPGQIHKINVDLPYQLIQVGERFYYFFPPGGVVLSMPYVAYLNALGISVFNENGMYDGREEDRMQKRLAPLLMASLAVIIFFTSRLLLSINWSLLVSLATGLGTQMWSTASRAMWAHTWGIFLLGFVIWHIVRIETKQAAVRPVLLATCLSWLYFVRPTFTATIIGVALYLLIYHRNKILPFVITGCAWLALFVVYSKYNFGTVLPDYYQGTRLHFTRNVWQAFAANLISPSRGLLVYVPVLAFVIYLLARYYKTSRQKLIVLASGIVIAHLLVVSMHIPWHAGHCYGPRFTTDSVPWFALLGILGLEARLRWRESHPGQDSAFRIRFESGVAAVLLIMSITLNGIGAWSKSAWQWNQRPINIDRAPGRVWDWKHPQFLGVPQDSTARTNESVASQS